MPIIINQIKCPLTMKSQQVIERGLLSLGLNSTCVKSVHIHKSSLDARKQYDISFVHSVYAELDDTQREKSLSEKYSTVTFVEPSVFKPTLAKNKPTNRVVITGFGPAGMFCGLVLAEQGYCPLIIERGEDIDSRTQSVQGYWRGGKLNESSNVQFGEGGAGTFSDGKLTSRIKDPLCRYVLERFIEFGAPEEILYKAKPHIGTDKLRNIVKNIRERVISLGGEIRFSTQLTDFHAKDGAIDKVCFTEGECEASALVLAIGHSARDTFEMLADKQIFMEAKPFAIGARIEHRQLAVNESLYGKNAGNPLLPEGEYQLTHRGKNGRGVYTFCMCPGGSVVAASSEEGGIVTNGMSEFARDKKNANAAVVVSCTPDDFGHGALDGMYFAREIEQSAFKLTGGKKAPATTVSGFLNGKPAMSANVTPSYQRGVVTADFTKIFPEFITDGLRSGLQDFARKMRCFSDGQAMLTAPETRTSSPVRISRNEDMSSLSVKNLYPCGEGAGYAGGIMSAAVDGIKAALSILKNEEL